METRCFLWSTNYNLNTIYMKFRADSIIFQTTVVTICTNNLTFSVFMCFVWIWDKTAIISLYSINWLVCITETECVHCAVHSVFLNTFHVNLNLSYTFIFYYYYQKDEQVKPGNLLIDWCSLSPPPCWVMTLSLSLCIFIPWGVIPLVFNSVSPVSVIPPTL